MNSEVKLLFVFFFWGGGDQVGGGGHRVDVNKELIYKMLGGGWGSGWM